jgi:hypothetical protein
MGRQDCSGQKVNCCITALCRHLPKANNDTARRTAGMTVLDTDVLVRYLMHDEPDQAKKASTIIEGAAPKGEIRPF